MSVAAYVRRAAVAFAELDTGVPWEETMEGEPGFGIYGERPGRGAIRVDGRGFGPWKIVKVESHHQDDDD